MNNVDKFHRNHKSIPHAAITNSTDSNHMQPFIILPKERMSCRSVEVECWPLVFLRQSVRSCLPAVHTYSCFTLNFFDNKKSCTQTNQLLYYLLLLINNTTFSLLLLLILFSHKQMLRVHSILSPMFAFARTAVLFAHQIQMKWTRTNYKICWCKLFLLSDKSQLFAQSEPWRSVMTTSSNDWSQVLLQL